MSTVHIDRLLETVIRVNGSDIHLHVGRPPVLRIDGRLRSEEIGGLEFPEKLFEADGAAWSGLETNRIDLIPAPVAMAAAVSMHMAVSQGHGKVKRLEALN